LSRKGATIELRDGAAADVALVAAMMEQAFDPMFGEAWTASQCLGIMALPGVWLTLASLDGRSAGFALARVAADEAELLLLATVPDARRSGVGRMLLSAVIDRARRHGAREIHLEVRERNEAICLYQKEGFVEVGRRRDYYQGKTGRRFDALSYRKSV
jgi:ribosomal-protein-alanine N-acetyltransferase